MRTIFDQCAKQLARDALGLSGRLETQREILPEVQAIDVAFEPGPEPLPALLGTLGQMAQVTCTLEPYSTPPDEDDLADCVLRQLAWHRERRNDAEKAKLPSPARPWLWVLSAQRIHAFRHRCGFVPAHDAAPQDHPQQVWPAGFHFPAPIHHVGLVVLPDLPRSDETLLLRMMGRGSTRNGAIEDAFGLPLHDPRRPMIAELVTRLRIELPPSVQPQEDLMSDLHFPLYDQFISNIRQEGRAQPLRKVLERKLASPLTDQELEALLARLARIDDDTLADLIVDASVGRHHEVMVSLGLRP